MKHQAHHILVRRLRKIGVSHGMTPLDRRTMYKLAAMCCNTLGNGGITDVDLHILYRLTKRGLMDGTYPTVVSVPDLQRYWARQKLSSSGKV